jgi:hypothetical protein
MPRVWSVTAWASWQACDDSIDEPLAHGGDRSWDMSLRPQWGILWVGNRRIRQVAGTARRSAVPRGNRLRFGDQETVGGDAHGGVTVKAEPSASFEMPEADLLLEFLIVALDASAQLGGVDQIAKRNAFRQGPEPIFCGFFLALWPLDQQPLLRRSLGMLADRCRLNAHAGEPRGQPFIGALPPLDRAPRFCGQSERDLLRRDRIRCATVPLLRRAAGALARRPYQDLRLNAGRIRPSPTL